MSSSSDSPLFMASFSSANPSINGYAGRATPESPHCSKESGVTYILHVASTAAQEIMRIESDFRLTLLQQGRIVDNTAAAFRNPLAPDKDDLAQMEIKKINTQKSIRRTYNNTLARAARNLPSGPLRAPAFPSYKLDATITAFDRMVLAPSSADQQLLPPSKKEGSSILLCLRCGRCVVSCLSRLIADLPLATE